MYENIATVLLLIIYCISLILSYTGDLIIIKVKLHNCNPVIAEIIYFDEVSFIKGSFNVAIVSYSSNGLPPQDAVVLRAKKDKIGDTIEIVTDGKIAVRKKPTLKEGQSVGINIFFLIGILLLGRYFGTNEEIVIASVTLLLFMLIIAILYPLFYKAFDSEIKEKLGWRK